MKTRPNYKFWLLMIGLVLLGSFVMSKTNLFHQGGSPLPVMKPTSEKQTPEKPFVKEKIVPEKKVPHHLSEHIVEYHIDVSLDVKQKRLQGTQILTWKHPGDKDVSELYFHLYPNAFESKKSSFIRESGGKLRNDSMKKDSFGHMQITDIRTTNGENLTSRMKFVQPDDENKHDMTLMQLKLSKPISSGDKITLLFQFNVELPYTFARMGYVDDFIMAGQWFPKLAVYEKQGTRDRKSEGWNLHQYHGNSEFYADFGIYNVRIKVPRDYIVAATGFPTKKALIEGDTKTYHFYADDVHDFAWSASPDFVYVEEPFSTPDIPGVKIKLYLDPQHAHLKERYLYAAKRSLTRFSEWYGSYPYSTLSIVVPPEGGNGAGGMEYPTLVTAWAANDKNPDFELERVVVHEIGHQFWYGMVASNEFEEAWLDEAFTSYAEDKLMKMEYGVAGNSPVESSYVTSPASLKQYSWKYADHDQYADNVYIRGKLVLQDIEQQIGSKSMDRVLKKYFQRWKFKHPTTRDFQKVLEEVTDRKWEAYFKDFVYGDLMVDYSIEKIDVKLIKDEGESGEGKSTYESIVRIQKNGGHHSPVPILFQFTDGKKIKKSWDGVDTQIQFKLVHEAPLDWVAIDPEYSMILENKHINNFMKTSIEEKTKVRWNLGTVILLETLIEWVAW
jgi:hypothetical protein